MEPGEDEGKQWGAFAEFVLEPGLSDDERQRRKYIVGQWQERPPTLQTVTQEWWSQDQRALNLWCDRPDDLFRANREAWDHLSLYLREGRGLLIWRAFRAYRRQGLPVPEIILEKLDQWADRLEIANGADEVAEAVEMKGHSKAPGRGPERLRALERKRHIVSRVARMIEHNKGIPAPDKLTITQIYERVALELKHSHGTTDGKHVKKIYREWVRPSKQEPGAGLDKSLDAAVKSWSG